MTDITSPLLCYVHQLFSTANVESLTPALGDARHFNLNLLRLAYSVIPDSLFQALQTCQEVRNNQICKSNNMVHVEMAGIAQCWCQGFNIHCKQGVNTPPV